MILLVDEIYDRGQAACASLCKWCLIEAAGCVPLMAVAAASAFQSRPIHGSGKVRLTALHARQQGRISYGFISFRYGELRRKKAHPEDCTLTLKHMAIRLYRMVKNDDQERQAWAVSGSASVAGRKTRQKILHAAASEFGAKGYAGARMQGIANRAGVKKELLYYYFRGKEHLFGEVRDANMEADLRRAPSMPEDPADILVDRFTRVLGDVEWVRLITWEAAQGGERPVPRERERFETITKYVTALRTEQRKGRVMAGLDPRLLQLAIFALTTYPLAFNQITRLTTGYSATDPGFQRAWIRFLRELGKRLNVATTGQARQPEDRRRK